VKTQFGYHLIKVESKEDWTFDEAKPEIERRLKPEAAMKTMQELEKKDNVVLDPEFFNTPKQ
jgi:parvulin-like peptidyl-prolyl isomerase